MSSVKSTRVVHSSKYAQKKRARRMTTFFLLMFCFAILATSGILISRSSYLKIDSIVVKGVSDTLAGKVRMNALAAAGGGSKEVEKVLRENFHEINTLDVRRSGLRELTLKLMERTPAAIVCSGFRDEEDSSTCYLSDRSGFIFAPASTTLATQTFTRYYVPTDRGNSPIGTIFVDGNRFQDLEKFVSGARKGGLSPLGVLIGEHGEYEMYVKNMNSDSEVTIYFDDKSPFETTLSNLLVFWQNSRSTKQSFDYINLRFGNTVYYSTQ